MNSKKLQKLLQGQSSNAMAVYGATPIAESWTASEVYSEVKRTGHSIALARVNGCLNSLVHDGLVREPEPGKFVRVTVRRGRPPKMAIVDGNVTEVPIITEFEQKGEIEMADDFDPMLELMALSERMTQLRQDLDDAINKTGARMEKLREDAEDAADLLRLMKKIQDK